MVNKGAGAPTLDQLTVLATVVECGSFSAAARRLNRTQSVISYTIAGLEGQLGLRLFERGHRRPVLTESGRAVLADARRVVDLVGDLRARASAMSQGLEAELSLAADVMFPTDQLVAAIEDFARAFPTVSLRLRVEALGAVPQLVMEGACGLGISGSLGISGGLGVGPDVLWRREIAHIRLVPVAAPTHALARLRPPLTIAQLREHTQLVLSDRSKLTEGQDFGVVSLRTWRLGDLGAKHALLRAGLGWGNMPEATVRGDIESGRLVPLVMEQTNRASYPLLLIRRADAQPGPAARWLAFRIAEPPVATAGAPA